MNSKVTDTAQAKTRRVFFALWPDQQIRHKINQAFTSSAYTGLSRGRRYRDHNLHMTLHFLGDITQQQFDCVKAQAKQVQGRAFSLRIDHFGRFRRAGVLWLGPESVPDALNQLHTSLASELSLCDFQADEREYRPHITLMRKFHEKITQEKITQNKESSIEWQVNDFVLVESIPGDGGVTYKPVAHYPLHV